MFRQVVVLDPSFTEAQVKLANILLQAGRARRGLQPARDAHQGPSRLASGARSSLVIHAEAARPERGRPAYLREGRWPRTRPRTMAMRVMLEVAAGQDDLAGGVVHVEDILESRGRYACPPPPGSASIKLYLEYARGQINSPASTSRSSARACRFFSKASEKASIRTRRRWRELAKTYLGLGRRLDALKSLQQCQCHQTRAPTPSWSCIARSSRRAWGRNPTRSAITKKAFTLDPATAELRDDGGSLYRDLRRQSLPRYPKRFDVRRAPVRKSAGRDAANDPESRDRTWASPTRQTHHPDKAQACFQEVFDSPSRALRNAYLVLAYFPTRAKGVQAGWPDPRRRPGPLSRNRPAIRFLPGHPEPLREETMMPRWPASRRSARWPNGTEAGVLDKDFYLEDALTLEPGREKRRSSRRPCARG